MNIEPEDLMSAEEEAEIQRNHIMGHSEDVLEALERSLIFYKANPEAVTPEAYDLLAEAIANQKTWMLQNGIGLAQPDVAPEDNDK
jgi:uncharacterized protein (UPF0276 family)